MNDVIAGRKRLTPNSLEAVTVGLKLNKLWSEYLETLVGLEEPKFQNPSRDQEYFKNRLQSLRKKFAKRKSQILYQPTSPVVRIFLEASFPEVYAALGTVTEGASLAQVISRTRLPERELRSILARMIEAGLIEEKDDRFLPSVEALNVNEMKSHAVFEKDFFRSIEKAKKRFRTQASSDQALFMTQTFSVSSKKLQRFRRELAALIADFTSDAEAPDGDCVGEVVIAFTNSHC